MNRKSRRSVSFSVRLLSALAGFAALGAAGCATNPATGKSQLNFYSEAQEVEMGRQADREISAEMGLVDDPELQAYVREIGQRLAAKSERPNLPWSFKVMDDPAVNAFALPGGFVYVTRGILGHLSSEAELVGVMGHEIGHVTAQHSMNQMSKQQLAQGGLLIGMMVVPEVAQAADAASMGLGALFLKYGRDDERQADELGLRYMSATGYEVRELPKVFALLGKVGVAEGGSKVPNWLSSHPEPESREKQTNARIAAGSYPPGELREEAFLAEIDGIGFGPDPRQGFFAGGAFVHPALAFTFRPPAGWKGTNGLKDVSALHPEKVALVTLRVDGSASAAAAAQKFLASEGVSGAVRDRPRLHGLAAERVDFALPTSSGSLPGRAVFVEHKGTVFAFYGLARAERWNELGSVIDVALSSFAPLTDPELLAARSQRIEVVRLSRAMSFQEFLSQYPSEAPAATVALINAMDDSSRVLPSGTRMKRIVGRRYGDGS